ncbi:MAG: hypothetical protein KKF44_08890 [Nanoarchaeota archaeon]|nr:hypothetical protein [Nanoarchaeota archaeon]
MKSGEQKMERTFEKINKFVSEHMRRAPKDFRISLYCNKEQDLETVVIEFKDEEKGAEETAPKEYIG